MMLSEKSLISEPHHATLTSKEIPIDEPLNRELTECCPSRLVRFTGVKLISMTFMVVAGHPYVEVHHIRRLSDGGLDHPIN